MKLHYLPFFRKFYMLFYLPLSMYLKKPTHETLTAQQIFNATILLTEPDKSTVKWPKQKFHLPRGKTQVTPIHRSFGDGGIYRKILRLNGRDLSQCEDCQSRDNRTVVHHLNLNHYDNRVENLLVLCKACHAKRHCIDEVASDSDGCVFEDF